MTESFIDQPAALHALCEALADEPWLTLDTEFMRERTYFPRLCLIQVAAPGRAACIDPLALADLSPLLELLGDRRRLKVLHSARQDLEVLSALCGSPPAPIFDTQIAAGLLGYDHQIGYAALVQALTGERLDKAHTRANWALRPLSPEQVRYALDDVVHLRQIYPILAARLYALGRGHWLEQECAPLTERALYENPAEAAYQRLRGGDRLAPAGQERLRALATWRERTAQRLDIPRNWVLRDPVLAELARRAPATLEQLRRIDDLPEAAKRRWGRELLEVMAAAGPGDGTPLWPQPPHLTPEQAARREALMARAQRLARAHQLDPALLATRRDLEQLVLDGAGARGLARGWRAEILGAGLEALLTEEAPARPGGTPD